MGYDSQQNSKPNEDPADSRSLDAYETLSRTEVTWNLANLASDRTEKSDRSTERSSTATVAPKMDWRDQMHEVSNELKLLKTMDVNDPRRAELIRDVDERFQRSMPQIIADSKGTDGRLVVGVVEADNSGERFQQLLKDKDVETAVKKENPDLSKLTADDVQNAILHASTPEIQGKLQELFAVGQRQSLALVAASEAASSNRAAVLAPLRYADFLNTYKKGHSTTSDGTVFTSLDVLNSGASAELAANVEHRAVQGAAQDAAAARQAEVVPEEQNPLTYLRQSMEAGTPKDRIDAAKLAVYMASNKQFEPSEIQKKIEALEKGSDQSAEVKSQIAAWKDLKHVRGMAETWAAYSLFDQKNIDIPTLKEAKEHLEKAKLDPEATKFLKNDRGEPLFDQLETRINKLYEPVAVELHRASFERNMQLFQEATNLIPVAAQARKPDEITRLRGIAEKAAREAIEDGKAINKIIGPQLKDIEKEAEKLAKKSNRSEQEEEKYQAYKWLSEEASHFEGRGMLCLAACDMDKNDHDAALRLVNELRHMDGARHDANEDFQKQLALLGSCAQRAHDYQEAGLLEKGWMNTEDFAAGTWDWIKNNGRVVAMVVGFVAAAGITIGTGGLGAPAGAAILMGVLGGTAAGAAAGGACDVAAGKTDSFGKGMYNNVVPAFSGALAGATMTGVVAAPAAEGAAAARFAPLLGREAATKLVLPWTSNAARGAVLWGTAAAPVNIENAAKKYKEGKTSLGGAVLSGLGDEAQSIASGALFGGQFKRLPFLGLAAGKNVAIEGSKYLFSSEGPKSLSEVGWNVTADTLGDFVTKPARMAGPLFETTTHKQSRALFSFGRALATGNPGFLSDDAKREFNLPVLPPQPEPGQPKTDAAKPKTDAAIPKTDAAKPKPDAAKPKPATTEPPKLETQGNTPADIAKPDKRPPGKPPKPESIDFGQFIRDDDK